MFPGIFSWHPVGHSWAAPLSAFQYHVLVLCRRQLCRRSQRNKSAMDANDETGRQVPPPTASPASLAKCALRRQTPWVGVECPNRARSSVAKPLSRNRGSRNSARVTTTPKIERAGRQPGDTHD
jgi:hypothetical protein